MLGLIYWDESSVPSDDSRNYWPFSVVQKVMSMWLQLRPTNCTIHSFRERQVRPTAWTWSTLGRKKTDWYPLVQWTVFPQTEHFKAQCELCITLRKCRTFTPEWIWQQHAIVNDIRVLQIGIKIKGQNRLMAVIRGCWLKLRAWQF